MIIANFGRALAVAMLAMVMVALPTTLAKPIPQPKPNPSSLGPWTLHAKRTASVPVTYVAQGPAEDDQVVTLRIGVKMGDEEGLERELMRASMPGTAGDYLSREEVVKFSRLSQESTWAIQEWLEAHSVPFEAMSASSTGDQITLILPVERANALLGTSFVRYIHTPTGRDVQRMMGYRLPERVYGHVEFVHPTTVFDRDLSFASSPSSSELAHRELNTNAKRSLLGGKGGGGILPQVLPPFRIPLLQPPAEDPPISFANGVSGGLGAGSDSTDSGAGDDGKLPDGCKNATTPACLAALYGLPLGGGGNGTRSGLGRGAGAGGSKYGMAVMGFIDQFANRRDLKTFIEKFRPDIPKSQSSSVTFKDEHLDGGSNSQEASDAGIEANLDIQYSLGLTASAGTPRAGLNVSFVSVGNNNMDGDLSGFMDTVEWFMTMGDEELPRVITTRYGANEADLDPKLQKNLCNAYMQLASRGVTVLFSSGDGGVAGTAPHGEECKNFLPTFPSGCLYVTSVGSTHSFGPEKASHFSSGRFSTTFKVPSWQEKAVSHYLEKIKADGKFDKIKGLFDEGGRGFPDLALQGEHYQVVVGGKTGSVSGTSASTPVFAAIVSMLNAELSSAGKKPIGFLNPLLYSPGAQAAFNDVTTGRNPGCKTDGFWATDGWDAVSGFGTPKYQALRTLVGLPA